MTSAEDNNYDRIDRLQAHWKLQGDSWLPVDPQTLNATQIVDDYFEREKLTCCSFQIGFFIDINGKNWCTKYTCDEPWMTMTFIKAVLFDLDTASDQESTSAWPWEESRMKLWRKGRALTMEDPPGRMRRVRVDYHEFRRRMREEAEKLGKLVDQVVAEAKERESRLMELHGNENEDRKSPYKTICEELYSLTWNNIQLCIKN
eukprot:gb/GECH01000045.1/.p1 GENE.gb/GECH01000045.1/~~gb/GECH01000045.1/.p1  ORF type:complete len:203 (+),score=38.30 gb/GECH01000045.1/:1-609(+)